MDISKVYILTYRFGSNPHAMQMGFSFAGELRQAIDRARKFCDNVGYRFHSVRPLVENLEKIEARHFGTDTEYPAQAKELPPPS